MARKRLSRKELLQKDEITSRLEEAAFYVLDRPKPFLMGIGAVAAVVLLIVGWQLYAANRVAASQTALSGVIRTYHDATANPADETRMVATVAVARQVAEQYAGFQAADVARYYEALAEEGLGNTEASERLLRGLAASGDESIRQVARYALAESYKGRGELDEAIAVYREIVAAGPYAQGAILFELGLLLEAVSRPDEARQYYESIVTEFPNSPFRLDADRALRRLRESGGEVSVRNESTEISA